MKHCWHWIGQDNLNTGETIERHICCFCGEKIRIDKIERRVMSPGHGRFDPNWELKSVLKNTDFMDAECPSRPEIGATNAAGSAEGYSVQCVNCGNIYFPKLIIPAECPYCGHLYFAEVGKEMGNEAP